MRLKKLPSLQFVITDRMSLISPLNSNDRSIPLSTVYLHSFLNVKTGVNVPMVGNKDFFKVICFLNLKARRKE